MFIFSLNNECTGGIRCLETELVAAVVVLFSFPLLFLLLLRTKRKQFRAIATIVSVNKYVTIRQSRMEGGWVGADAELHRNRKSTVACCVEGLSSLS